MEKNSLDKPRRKATTPRMPWSLRLLLLSLWMSSIVFTAYETWHIDQVDHQQFSMVGLIIHCLIVGVLGLIVVTLIENRFVV